MMSVDCEQCSDSYQCLKRVPASCRIQSSTATLWRDQRFFCGLASCDAPGLLLLGSSCPSRPEALACTPHIAARVVTGIYTQTPLVLATLNAKSARSYKHLCERQSKRRCTLSSTCSFPLYSSTLVTLAH